jgi:hypothetical protein
LDSIPGKNLRGITGEISGQYFWKKFEGVTEEIFVGYLRRILERIYTTIFYLLISTRKQTF